MGSLSKIKEVSIILLKKNFILQIDTLHHAIYPFTETCSHMKEKTTVKIWDSKKGG